MKTQPGVKIIGFTILALTVALGVYAATQNVPEPAPTSPNVVIEFGLGQPLKNVKYKRALKIIQRIQKDPNLYIVQNYNEKGEVIDHEGHMTSCRPLPGGSTNTSPTPSATPAPTRSPASGAEASASATPSGAKTQTAGAVALSLGQSQEFYKLLNASTRGEHRKKKKSKDE